jgi:hypothetical protein
MMILDYEVDKKMKGTAPFLLDVVTSLQHSARTGSIAA